MLVAVGFGVAEPTQSPTLGPPAIARFWVGHLIDPTGDLPQQPQEIPICRASPRRRVVVLSLVALVSKYLPRCPHRGEHTTEACGSGRKDTTGGPVGPPVHESAFRSHCPHLRGSSE